MTRFKLSIFVFLLIAVPQISSAAIIDILLGDVDGFGFSDVSGLTSATGDPVDRNGNGVLDEGDSLPDLNADGRVDPHSADQFDNRSATDPLFTDIGQAYSGQLNFDFSFSIPINEKVDSATFYLVVGDASLANVGAHQITIDGIYTGFNVEPRQPNPVGDGLITVTEVNLPDNLLNNFDDGYAIFGIDYSLFPDDLAIDYTHLVLTTTPVPLPPSILLFGSAIGIVSFARIRKKNLNV